MTSEPASMKKSPVPKISATCPPVSPTRTLFHGFMAGILFLLVAGCGSVPRDGSIRDLRCIAQNASIADTKTATDLSSVSPLPAQRSARARDYLTRFFAPWHLHKDSLYASSKLFRPAASFLNKEFFSENLRPWPAGELQDLVDACDRPSFPNTDRTAITIRDTSLRALPTNRPAFSSPALPGEGFPFDYFQYSTLWTGTPLHVCQISLNRAWALVEAGFAYGWMPVDDLAFVDEADAESLQNKTFVVPLTDATPLVDTAGIYRCLTRIGALYPVETDEAGENRLLLPTADTNRRAVFVRAPLPPATLAPFPLPLTRERQTGLAQELIGQNYGWGGMFFNRDCSAMTRDFMGSFGIWLFRNSSQQARQGRRVELAGMSPGEKEKIIREQAVPFRTLIWMPGHVTLYIGQHKGRALILHNTWGLRTKTWSGQEGRHIIGKTVITTLKPGVELPDLDTPGGLLINKVTGLSILP